MRSMWVLSSGRTHRSINHLLLEASDLACMLMSFVPPCCLNLIISSCFIVTVLWGKSKNAFWNAFVRGGSMR